MVCDEVSVSYRDGTGQTKPLDGISFRVGEEPVALMGPSGSGKSTLIRVLAGIQSPDSGTVAIDGTPIRHSRRSGNVDERVSVVYQDYRLVDFLTVSENLGLAAELRGIDCDQAAMDQALNAVGLDRFGDRPPRTLSGGEQQRVAIARALLLGCRVLLADEPSGALDAENSRVVARLLRGLAEQQGVIVVVATHDPEVAATMPRRIMLRTPQRQAIV